MPALIITAMNQTLSSMCSYFEFCDSSFKDIYLKLILPIIIRRNMITKII